MGAVREDADEEERDGDTQRFVVVHKCVVFRKTPSTKAEMVFVAKRGSFLSGTVRTFDGHSWVHVSPEDCKERNILGAEAWVLIHGECVGLGDLLRPVHEGVEQLEELLWRMSGDSGDRVRPLVGALHDVGLRTASALLLELHAHGAVEDLQARLSEAASDRGCVLPGPCVASLKMAVEDSRLAFGGFPQAPPCTKSRILFTAPHSLPLCRAGHEAHQPEAHTSRLARDFASIVGGAYLTWAGHEERRALEVFKRTRAPDPSNRDPNFTHRDDVSRSPWARNLNEIRQLFGPGRPLLHVDLHGCKDPSPAGGSHLVVGLRATELAGRLGVEALRAALQLTLSIALRGVSVNVRPVRQLTGAALEEDFRTLSQQSLSEDGGAWSCAAQLEMSRTLRQELVRNKEARVLMAQAISYAWTLASGEAPDPASTLHTLQYWLARCKALYNRKQGDGTLLGMEEPDGEEERELEGPGELTANSEARAPLPDLPMATLEADAVAAARALRKAEDAHGHSGSMAPAEGGELVRCAWRESPVAMLRDWLRMTAETIPPLRPSGHFTIVGTWGDFVPEEMRWDGAHFSHVVVVGQRGWESFQILADGDWGRVLYPSVPWASPFKEHRLCGPDRQGHGKNWAIGLPRPEAGERNVARPGEVYRIALAVGAAPEDPGAAAPRDVAWELLGLRGRAMEGLLSCAPRSAPAAGDASPSSRRPGDDAPPARPAELSHIVVHIDRDLGLVVELPVKPGATVADVKAEIAAMDPTGRTSPGDFELRPPSRPCLGDEVVLAGGLGELEVCGPQ